MSRILIGVVLVVIVCVVCFVLRKPVMKYASKVWNWVVKKGQRATSYVRGKCTRKKMKQLVKCSCGESRLY